MEFDFPVVTTPGKTIYAYPADRTAFSLADYTTSDHRIAMPEGSGADVGSYLCTIDTDVCMVWVAFEGASQPAGWHEAIGAADYSADVAAAIITADQQILLDGDDYVLRTYARGTTTELIPAKKILRPGGADLTNPTTQQLGGFEEVP